MSTELFQNINKFVSIEESEFEKIILYFSRENVKKKELLMGIGDKVMKYILSYSKEEIYFRFRDSFPEFVNSVPQYLIASYLGLTEEYISKLKRKRNS